MSEKPNYSSTAENQIEGYVHCVRCLKELPENTSPMEYARTQFGFTKDGGTQVWCNRHDINVGLFPRGFEIPR